MEALTINRTLNMARAENSRHRHTAIADRRGILHHMEPGFADLMREEWQDWSGRHLPKPLHEVLSNSGERYGGRTMIVASHRIQDLLFLKARKRLPIDGLTARELVVARHVATGLTHKEIARELTLSPATVRVHLQRIHDKLNVRNNAELAAQLALIDH